MLAAAGPASATFFSDWSFVGWNLLGSSGKTVGRRLMGCWLAFDGYRFVLRLELRCSWRYPVGRTINIR
jgi:hypothetical protein